MKIITILNFKGGVGKSETTKNIAKGFVDSGLKVLVVDNDPQANTTKALNGSISLDQISISQNIQTEKDLINMFMDIDEDTGIYLEDLYSEPTKTLKAIRKTKIKNLDLLSCSLKLANTDTTLRLDTMKPQQDRLKKVLRQVKDNYDYCIIDCPPILNLLTINALIASNCDCIIPIKVDFAGLQGWSMTVNFINALKSSFDLEIDYKVVFTMVQKTSRGWIKTSNKIIELFNQIIPSKTLKTIIRNQTAPVIDAGFKSKFVINDHAANVGQDYRDLVIEIKNKENGEE
ncbi:MAG: AAA family ATPase [Coprobacillus sp.]